MSEPLVKPPCKNCPFRPRTFTPLAPDDVDAMLDEVLCRASFSMYCHKDLLYQNVECRGSVLFKRGDQSGLVFKSVAALTRAHGQTRRTPEFSWRHDGEEDT
jgi:hypothetical protein